MVMWCLRDSVGGWWIRRVRQRRRVLMVRRRGRAAVMVMRRRVYVTAAVADRVCLMRPGCAVHVVQQIVMRRQRVVVQVQDVRQQRSAASLVELQVTVRLARTWNKCVPRNTNVKTKTKNRFN